MMTLVAAWVCAIATACLAGWALSLGGWLSCPGYGVIAALAALAGFAYLLWRRPAIPRWRLVRARLRRRVTAPLSALYCVQLVLAGVGGALYAPNNFDFLIYRFPRVLHWLAVGRWQWIPTGVARMNYAGTSQEWVLSALYACSHSDRAFFLLNLTSFALLPGLCFVVLRALGVRRHPAWVWMWLLPSAPGYAMQAGGVANDAIALSLLLAALVFATRRSPLTFLAAALLSGLKASNLPLLVPCAVALAPSWRLVVRRPLVVGLALVVSFAPTAVFNIRHTGDWAGDPHNVTQLRAHDPLSALLGNTLQAAFVNVSPPFLPHAPEISQAATRFTASLTAYFPDFHLAVNELPQEDWSGLGLGVSALAFSCLFWRGRRRVSWIIAAGWVALIFPMTLLASDATARLLAPYYFLPLAGVLRWLGAERMARNRVWRALAVASSATTCAALVLTPARPLFPAQRLTARFSRAHAVYSRSAHYPYLFDSVLALLPPGSSRLGLINGGPESPLWRPYGTRVVTDIPDTLALDAFDGDAVIRLVGPVDSAIESRMSVLRAEGRLRHVGGVSVPVGFSIGSLTWDVDVRQKLGPMDHRQ